jgi:hypothetical protein
MYQSAYKPQLKLGVLMKLSLNKIEQGPSLAKGEEGEIGKNCGTTGYNTSDSTTVGVNKDGIGVGSNLGGGECISGGYDPRDDSVGVRYTSSC